MKTFYFDVSDGLDLTVDSEGIGLDSDEAVARCALEGLVDLAREVVPGSRRRRLTVEVRSDAQEVVYRAALEVAEEWVCRQDSGSQPPER